MRENQIVSASDTEARLAQRRDLLNQWMLRLPLKERQSRWGEYAARMCQLEKDVEREIRLKKKPTVSFGGTDGDRDNRIRLKSKRTPA